MEDLKTGKLINSRCIAFDKGLSAKSLNNCRKRVKDYFNLRYFEKETEITKYVRGYSTYQQLMYVRGFLIENYADAREFFETTKKHIPEKIIYTYSDYLEFIIDEIQ